MKGKQTTKKRRAAMVERLMRKAYECAVACGEAQWTNGYRASAEKYLSSSESKSLWEKEQAQWIEVDRLDAQFRRLAVRLIREAASVR